MCEQNTPHKDTKGTKNNLCVSVSLCENNIPHKDTKSTKNNLCVSVPLCEKTIPHKDTKAQRVFFVSSSLCVSVPLCEENIPHKDTKVQRGFAVSSSLCVSAPLCEAIFPHTKGLSPCAWGAPHRPNSRVSRLMLRCSTVGRPWGHVRGRSDCSNCSTSARISSGVKILPARIAA